MADQFDPNDPDLLDPPGQPWPGFKGASEDDVIQTLRERRDRLRALGGDNVDNQIAATAAAVLNYERVTDNRDAVIREAARMYEGAVAGDAGEGDAGAPRKVPDVAEPWPGYDAMEDEEEAIKELDRRAHRLLFEANREVIALHAAVQNYERVRPKKPKVREHAEREHDATMTKN